MNFKIKSCENTLWYKQSASNFNNALPIGNGRIGAVVYGGIEEETISINEDTLWSGYPRDNNVEDYPAVYKKAQEIFDSGKKLEAKKYLEGNFGDYLNQMYLPLADIKIEQKHNGKVMGYRRSLKLDSAVHTVKYSEGDCVFSREAFVSEPFQVIAVRYSCNQKGKINFKALVEGRLKCEYPESENLVLMQGTAPICKAEYGDMYRNTDYQIYEGQDVSYRCAMAVKTVGGSVEYSGNTATVKDADEAIIYLGVRTNFERFDIMPTSSEYKDKCIDDVKKALWAEYGDIKKKSITAHKKLYNKCGISLSNGENSRIPTDERLNRLEQGKEDNGLYTLLFNYGRYLTICASRKGTQAMNLQGIWNDKIIPPWSSNYTTNINTEMNYWPTLPCGLFDCYEPLIRFVEELSKSGKKTAEIFYGVSGWTSHHNSDLWRITHPATNRLNNNAQWGFWCMSSGWLSVMLWNYYRYTLDKKYLKRIYPVISGAAEFYQNLLIEDEGKLILPLTTSPENNYIENSDVIPIDKSSGMTQEIIIDLFTAVGEAQEILGKKNTYKEIVPRLKRPGICSNGELCEWHTEHEVWDVHHRHVSHLYGLFPADLFDEKERRAAKKVLLSRGDDGTGWSLAWKINLWARLGDGNHALTLIKNQLKQVDADYISMDIPGGSYPNLLCAHPPFQIDGNFGAASGIIEMLVQCDKEGNVKLLPALPDSWKNGQVKNLRLPGKKSVSFAWENGKIIYSEIKENVKC